MKYAPSADPAVVVPPPVPAPRGDTRGPSLLRRPARTFRIIALVCLAAAAVWIAATVVQFAVGGAPVIVVGSAVVAAVWVIAALAWLTLATRLEKRGTR